MRKSLREAFKFSLFSAKIKNCLSHRKIDFDLEKLLSLEKEFLQTKKENEELQSQRNLASQSIQKESAENRENLKALSNKAPAPFKKIKRLFAIFTPRLISNIPSFSAIS